MSAQSFETDQEGYVKLVAVEEVPPGEMVQVELVFDGLPMEVALANTEGEIFAFKDICPHMNYPLSIGWLRGTNLECRGHSWKFNIRTGKAISPPIRKTLDRYAVKVVDGTIWVKLDSPIQ